MKNIILVMFSLMSFSSFAQTVVTMAPGEARTGYSSDGKSAVFLCGGTQQGDDIDRVVQQLLSGQIYKSCQVLEIERGYQYKLVLKNFRTDTILASTDSVFMDHRGKLIEKLKPMIYPVLARNECY